MDLRHERVLPLELAGTLPGLLKSGGLSTGALADVLLAQSALNNASDLHFEPFYEGVRVRYRIDGILQEIVRLNAKTHDQIIARLKVMANLMPHKRDIPQEGRISMEVGGAKLDFRVSVIPTVGGEKGVVRIFDPQRALFSVDQLGFPPDVRAAYEHLLMDMEGILIITGPSSSGKTTTMYAGLQKIYEEKGEYACITTIEDPVEYELGMFSQMEVNRHAGIDFAAGLRALLRQDPEVIMVGEIRDFETCQIALRASLTGHLVLTTIHAGNTCEVLTRLHDMGIEPFVIASSVKGIMATRLIRKVCPDCRAPYQPEKRTLETFSHIAPHVASALYAGKGCSLCNQTGYRGRTSICELLIMNDELRQLVLEKAPTARLMKAARAAGTRSLLECGLDRMADGTTTAEELLRVLGTSTGKQDLSRIVVEEAESQILAAIDPSDLDGGSSGPPPAPRRPPSQTGSSFLERLGRITAES